MMTSRENTSGSGLGAVTCWSQRDWERTMGHDSRFRVGQLWLSQGELECGFGLVIGIVSDGKPRMYVFNDGAAPAMVTWSPLTSDVLVSDVT